MAPGYRTTGQSRRNNRGQIDHDVFEGLPVRNWRREVVTVTPAPVPIAPSHQNRWDIEHYRGMPRDSHLLSPHNQELLKIARSGKAHQKRAHQDEEEVEAENIGNGEGKEKKVEDTKDKGYQVKTWKPVTRHVEGSEFEFLAKRRKGLRGHNASDNNVSMVTRATVRKTDAEGKSYVEEIIVAEGQILEGEVISLTRVPDSAGGGIDSTPRKRMIPPKRKPKGPGRGRKKKLPLPVSVVDSDGAIVKSEGPISIEGVGHASKDGHGIKLEAQSADNIVVNADAEIRPEEGDEDEDGDDAEDGSDDDEDDDDDGDDQDQDQDQDMPDKDVSTPTPVSRIENSSMSFTRREDVNTDNAAQHTQSSVPQENNNLQHAHNDEEEAEGDEDDDIVPQNNKEAHSHQHSHDQVIPMPSYYSSEGLNMQSLVENTISGDFGDDDDVDNEMLDFRQEAADTNSHDGGYPYRAHHSNFSNSAHHEQSSYGNVEHSYEIQTDEPDFDNIAQHEESSSQQAGEVPESFQALLDNDDDDNDFAVLDALDAHLGGEEGEVMANMTTEDKETI